MKKMFIGLIAAVSLMTVLAGCQAEPTKERPGTESPQTETPGNTETEKIKVATSIHPVNELVRIVGGNYVDTWKIVPEGAEAHDFEPTIKDMGELSKVKFLFINGLGMEPWMEKAVANSGNTSLKVLDLSEGVSLIDLEGHDHDHDDHEGEDAHDHGEFDPHIWLSIDALITMADHVRQELIEMVPDGEEDFQRNFEDFRNEATSLKETYQEKFRPHKGKAFVTGHAAFGYMTREMGLTQKAIEGPFQEGEPTPKKLQDLIDFVKSEKITTIFLEEAASPKVSETLARETGGKTVTINALEAEGDLLENLEDIYKKVLESFEGL
jgi:zinc transport system substrate-binding protein